MLLHSNISTKCQKWHLKIIKIMFIFIRVTEVDPDGYWRKTSDLKRSIDREFCHHSRLPNMPTRSNGINSNRTTTVKNGQKHDQTLKN